MAEILFYHLERAKLQVVLSGLLEKSLERAWKALVVSGDATRLSDLDDELWTFREESFLPHATLEASEDPAREPVLLTARNDDVSAPLNEADILFLVEGADAVPADMHSYQRCVIIFDGRDDEALQRARDFWKIIRDYRPGNNEVAFEQTYWRQSGNGRWEKQA